MNHQETTPTEIKLLTELLQTPEYLRVADLGVARRKYQENDKEKIKNVLATMETIEEEDRLYNGRAEEEYESTKNIREKDIRMACPDMASQFLKERNK